MEIKWLDEKLIHGVRQSNAYGDNFWWFLNIYLWTKTGLPSLRGVNNFIVKKSSINGITQILKYLFLGFQDIAMCLDLTLLWNVYYYLLWNIQTKVAPFTRWYINRKYNNTHLRHRESHIMVYLLVNNEYMLALEITDYLFTYF